MKVSGDIYFVDLDEKRENQIDFSSVLDKSIIKGEKGTKSRKWKDEREEEESLLSTKKTKIERLYIIVILCKLYNRNSRLIYTRLRRLTD